jgi:hypothetical protein
LKADYVAVLNAADTQTDLTGWVTITTGGATYQNAQLIRWPAMLPGWEENRPAGGKQDGCAGSGASNSKRVFFEYHLYTLTEEPRERQPD